MPDDLHDPWLALLAAVRREFDAHGGDPNSVEADEQDLRISLPLEGNEYYSHHFKKAEVLKDNPAELAARLYADYQTHRTPSVGA
jgi:hypothetical protein